VHAPPLCPGRCPRAALSWGSGQALLTVAAPCRALVVPETSAVQAAAPGDEGLRRCLGPVAVTAQAVATIGLTLTAVINIPEAMRSAGRATWISYAVALAAVLLVSETLVLFRRLPARPSGIAGYVEAGLGPRPAAEDRAS